MLPPDKLQDFCIISVNHGKYLELRVTHLLSTEYFIGFVNLEQRTGPARGGKSGRRTRHGQKAEQSKRMTRFMAAGVFAASMAVFVATQGTDEPIDRTPVVAVESEDDSSSPLVIRIQQSRHEARCEALRHAIQAIDRKHEEIMLAQKENEIDALVVLSSLALNATETGALSEGQQRRVRLIAGAYPDSAVEKEALSLLERSSP